MNEYYKYLYIRHLQNQAFFGRSVCMAAFYYGMLGKVGGCGSNGTDKREKITKITVTNLDNLKQQMVYVADGFPNDIDLKTRVNNISTTKDIDQNSQIVYSRYPNGTAYHQNNISEIKANVQDFIDKHNSKTNVMFV